MLPQIMPLPWLLVFSFVFFLYLFLYFYLTFSGSLSLGGLSEPKKISLRGLLFLW